VKLGLILVLVALLVPTVLWLVRGDGWDIVVKDAYKPGRYYSASLRAAGRDPNDYTRPPVTIPLRPILAGSAVCVAVGVYLLATRKPR